MSALENRNLKLCVQLLRFLHDSGHKWGFAPLLFVEQPKVPLLKTKFLSADIKQIVIPFDELFNGFITILGAIRKPLLEKPCDNVRYSRARSAKLANRSEEHTSELQS